MLPGRTGAGGMTRELTMLLRVLPPFWKKIGVDGVGTAVLFKGQFEAVLLVSLGPSTFEASRFFWSTDLRISTVSKDATLH